MLCSCPPFFLKPFSATEREEEKREDSIEHLKKKAEKQAAHGDKTTNYHYFLSITGREGNAGITHRSYTLKSLSQAFKPSGCWRWLESALDIKERAPVHFSAWTASPKNSAGSGPLALFNLKKGLPVTPQITCKAFFKWTASEHTMVFLPLLDGNSQRYLSLSSSTCERFTARRRSICS